MLGLLLLCPRLCKERWGQVIKFTCKVSQIEHARLELDEHKGVRIQETPAWCAAWPQQCHSISEKDHNVISLPISVMTWARTARILVLATGIAGITFTLSLRLLFRCCGTLLSGVCPASLKLFKLFALQLLKPVQERTKYAGCCNMPLKVWAYHMASVIEMLWNILPTQGQPSRSSHTHTNMKDRPLRVSLRFFLRSLQRICRLVQLSKGLLERLLTRSHDLLVVSQSLLRRVCKNCGPFLATCRAQLSNSGLPVKFAKDRIRRRVEAFRPQCQQLLQASNHHLSEPTAQDKCVGQKACEANRESNKWSLESWRILSTKTKQLASKQLITVRKFLRPLSAEGDFSNQFLKLLNPPVLHDKGLPFDFQCFQLCVCGCLFRLLWLILLVCWRFLWLLILLNLAGSSRRFAFLSSCSRRRALRFLQHGPGVHEVQAWCWRNEIEGMLRIDLLNLNQSSARLSKSPAPTWASNLDSNRPGTPLKQEHVHLASQLNRGLADFKTQSGTFPDPLHFLGVAASIYGMRGAFPDFPRCAHLGSLGKHSSVKLRQTQVSERVITARDFGISDCIIPLLLTFSVWPIVPFLPFLLEPGRLAIHRSTWLRNNETTAWSRSGTPIGCAGLCNRWHWPHTKIKKLNGWTLGSWGKVRAAGGKVPRTVKQSKNRGPDSGVRDQLTFLAPAALPFVVLDVLWLLSRCQFVPIPYVVTTEPVRTVTLTALHLVAILTCVCCRYQVATVHTPHEHSRKGKTDNLKGALGVIGTFLNCKLNNASTDTWSWGLDLPPPWQGWKAHMHQLLKPFGPIAATSSLGVSHKKMVFTELLWTQLQISKEASRTRRACTCAAWFFPRTESIGGRSVNPVVWSMTKPLSTSGLQRHCASNFQPICTIPCGYTPGPSPGNTSSTLLLPACKELSGEVKVLSHEQNGLAVPAKPGYSRLLEPANGRDLS